MPEIPEDVMREAVSAVHSDELLHIIVARAILAERKRCAEVAAELPLCRLKSVSPSGGVTPKMAFGVGADAQRAAIANAIAAAIRKGD